MISSLHSRPWLRRTASMLLPALLLAISIGCTVNTPVVNEADNEDLEAARGNNAVLPEVINAPPGQAAHVLPSLDTTAFTTPQTRLGYFSGQQWEPAIAADRSDHVYVLYAQYHGVPGCATCPSPTLILQTSNDRGMNWAAPRQIAPPGTGQWDPQIVVDPIDGKTVMASWLQNNKSDTIVARSADFGQTWSAVVADSTQSGTDKPILAVRGQDVYVGFNHAQKVWVAASHDGGQKFTSYDVNPNGKLGWSLPGGATVTTGGVYFAWAGYKQAGGANSQVILYISKSTDGGKTWTNTQLDTSASPPDCSAFSCGWAFLGAQATMTSDASGALYALWNSGSVNKGPEQIYFAKSTDAGKTWSTKTPISTAPSAFPAIVAGTAGDVRISWMDTRAGTYWNTYYKSSANGGATWSTETKLSNYVAGYTYIFTDGYSFPYGDYYEMDIDDQGNTHVVWGEGKSYSGDGSIWYSRGR
jgi:BNR repeat-like domain